jgi:hypothetical protein
MGAEYSLVDGEGFHKPVLEPPTIHIVRGLMLPTFRMMW